MAVAGSEYSCYISSELVYICLYVSSLINLNTKCICKTDYGQEEAIAVFGHDPRIYTTTVKEFKKDKKGNLEKVVTVQLESRVDEKTGRRMMVPVEGTEKELPCELVLIAAGFLFLQIGRAHV